MKVWIRSEEIWPSPLFVFERETWKDRKGEVHDSNRGPLEVSEEKLAEWQRISREHEAMREEIRKLLDRAKGAS